MGKNEIIPWQRKALRLLMAYRSELYHEITLRETPRRNRMAKAAERQMKTVERVLQMAKDDGWEVG